MINNRWQVHCGRHEATRVAAPSLAARDGAAAIGADRAGIAAGNKIASHLQDVLVGLSIVETDFQYAAIESKDWIHA